jgi:hypothetical protein
LPYHRRQIFSWATFITQTITLFDPHLLESWGRKGGKRRRGQTNDRASDKINEDSKQKGDKKSNKAE